MKFSQSGELLLTLILKCLASLWPSSSCPFPVIQLKGHLSRAFFKRRSLLSTSTRGHHFWSWSERGRLKSIPWIWCYLSVFINLQQHWLKRSAKWWQNRHCFTHGCRPPLLYLSPDLLHTHRQWFEPKIPCLDSSHLKICCHTWHTTAFSLFHFLETGFLTDDTPSHVQLLQIC